MSKIKITNFGPIKGGFSEQDGWMDIKKVTVFIGNQGSGKSTIAKLVSTFTWIEKALVRGDYDKKWFAEKHRLKNTFFRYHRLENYFINYDSLFESTRIEYKGEAYNIKHENGQLIINESNNGNYKLPQIVYIPAERNFISYVKSPKELKLSSDSLKEFLAEFEKAKDATSHLVKLPVNDTHLEYDRYQDVLRIRGRDYSLRLSEASSGFQSIVPLFLVSAFLANSVRGTSEGEKEPMSIDELNRFKKGVSDIWSNENLTDEQKRAAISVLSSKFNKTAFINIVEEPEQNLFPSSQWKMLQSLLSFNNMNRGNKLILTTHSPYIVNFLSIAIQACALKTRIISKNETHLLQRLNNIIDPTASVQADDVIIYQMNEIEGTITRIPTYEGIPSDNNYLNEMLRKGNKSFDSLLEIEEEL